MSTLQVANVHFNTGGTSRFDVPLSNVVRLIVNSSNIAYATSTTLQVNVPLTANVANITTLYVAGAEVAPKLQPWFYIDQPTLTLSNTYIGGILLMSNTANMTVTVPANTLPSGATFDFMQWSGPNYKTKIVGASGMVVSSKDSNANTASRYSGISLRIFSGTSAGLVGDLVA